MFQDTPIFTHISLTDTMFLTIITLLLSELTIEQDHSTTEEEDEINYLENFIC
jgi:hypothetical protein